MFRLLNAHEINARVKQVICTDKWKGVTLLLYKDARCDMAILDEQYGQTNWQVDYQMIGNQMFCTISIWDANKEQWIRKQSNGVESNTEAEKGQASDAFKRAGFMLGIGRELYTAPDILITCDGDGEITSSKDNYGKDRYKCNCDFSVTDIDYDENRNICYLVITKKYKKNENVCLTWGKKMHTEEPKQSEKPRKGDSSKEEPPKPPKDDRPQWQKFYDSLKEKCSDTAKLNAILKQCGANRASEINAFVYGQVEKMLNET